MMIAAGIMSVVVFAGFQAFQYFNAQTSKEARKMDDISEFNALTKDLISFTEGAGISTFYLNMPIKTQGCTDAEPCVRQLNNQVFVPPTGTLPPALTANTCIQFYKDAKGVLEGKPAYPGKPIQDKIWEFKELELTNSDADLFATWVIKDLSSPPFMMMKSRDASLFLRQLKKPVQRSRTGNEGANNVKWSFFDSDAPIEVIKKLVGYPFLVYNAVFNNHYTIQYAVEVKACNEDSSGCVNIMKDIVGPTGTWTDAAISLDSGATYPDKVYAIKFQEMDFNAPFFKDIRDKQNLPAGCMSSWGEGKQSTTDYFFPSRALSVSGDSNNPENDLTGSNPVNILHLNHYYVDKGLQSIPKGIMVAVPIDIITFKAEAGVQPGTFSLVSELWHATEIKKKTKIHTLKGPFTLTRKLGSPELGIWYNPIKKQQ